MIQLLPEGRRSSMLCAAYLALLLTVVDDAVSSVTAAPPLSQAASYRRIFVPADSPETWPIGADRYLPIRATEFDRLVATANERPDAAAFLRPRINSITHRVTFVDAESMLKGSTELDVQIIASESGIVPLQPWRLPIISARWNHDRSRPAQLALWHRRDQTEVLGVWADRSDTLQLQWELPRQPVGGSEAEYILETPTAALQKLELTVPEKYGASVDFGQLLSTEAVADGRQRWIFQLAPQRSHRLRVTKRSAPSDRQVRARVSQADSYHLQPDGLTLTSTIRLDDQTEAPGELHLALPAGLEIVGVTIDEAPATWYRGRDSNTPQLVIQRPIARETQLIEVRGIASLKLDQPWELPALNARGVFWAEGSTTLLMAPALELKSLQPRLATLQDIVGLADDLPAEEVFRLQKSSPKASIAVILGRRRSRLTVQSATMLELGSTEATASTVAVVAGTAPGAFSLEAELGPGWSIESVTTVPSSALRHWHTYDAEGRLKMRADFSHPIGADQPLRMEINSRASGNEVSVAAQVGKLKPVSFDAQLVERELLLLRQRSAGDAELLHGADLLHEVKAARLEIETLDAADRELLPDTADGVLLDLQEMDDQQVVELRQKPPRYDAEIAIEVSVLPDALLHHYQLQCVPTSGAVSELLVEFDDELPDAAEWTMEGRVGALIVERIDPKATTDASVGPGFTYRIGLPGASAGTIRLSSNYELPAERSQRCNSIRLPDAENSRGQMVIRGPLDDVQLVDAGWVPAGWPAADKTTNPPLPLLGCYRLGTIEPRRPIPAKRLTLIRTGPGEAIAKVTAWFVDCVTLQSADGTALHEICYYLDNSGASQVEIVLPSAATLQETWQDALQVDPGEVLFDERTCRFRLEANERWQTLRLRYLLHGRALGQSTLVQANVPECSFPLSTGRWTLSTPEQYELDAVVASRTTNDLHWLRRLFGPLVRSRRTAKFHPLRGEDWKELWSAPIVGQQSKQAAEQTARKLVAGFSTSTEENWGDLLRRVSRELDIQDVLFVDSLALGKLGFRSTTSTTLLGSGPVDAMAGTTEQQSHLYPLPSRGLALVVSPTAIILTSEQRVAHWRNELRPTTTPGVYTIVSDRLATAADRLSTRFHTDILSVDDWLSTPVSNELPWDTPVNLLPAISRSAWTVEFVDTPPALVVYRGQARRALWNVVWLIGLVVGSSKYGRRPAWLVSAIALCAAICFVAPIHWLTIPQATLIGLLSAAILCQVFSSGRIPLPRRPVWHAATQSSSLATMLLAGCTILLSQSPTAAAEQPNIGAPVDGSLARVFVPVNERGEVQGEDVFVDESLLARLRPAPDLARRDGADYAILDAVYRGELPQEVSGGEASDDKGDLPTWSFTIDVECFIAGIRLRMPFRQEDAEWLSGRHRLNGQPTKLTWDGQGCSLELSHAGRHRLELLGKPVFARAEQRLQLAMRVPAAPAAKLELSLGNTVRDLQVSETGEVTVDEETGLATARLAPGKSLNISWTPHHGNASPALFDQLCWLRVLPSAAHVDVQLILREPITFPALVELAVAPHFKLVPLESDSPIEQVASPPGTLRLRLKENLVAPARIFLRFQLQRAESIGQIQYPLIRLKNSMANRSLFAVSVSPSMSFDENMSGVMRSIAASEFAQEWATDGEAPLYAYSVGDQTPRWSLRVWPGPEASTLRENVNVYCQRQGARVEYEAHLEQVVGRPLIYRLAVPQELRIDDVSIGRQPDLAQTAIRWSRVTDTEVSMFLSQPLQRAQVLTLQGWTEAGEDNRLGLPKISMLDQEQSDITVNLYRRADVLIDLKDTAGELEQLQQQSTTRPGAEILVGRYSWRIGSVGTTPTLRFERNEPRFRADTLLTVKRSDTEKTAVLNARIHVTDGVLSELRVRAPAVFESPYTLEPAKLGTVANVQRPDGSQELTLRLARPIPPRQQVEFGLTGRLVPRADHLLEVPNVKLMDAERHRQYVLLPTQLGGQQINWRRPLGLRRHAIPNSMRAWVDSHSRSLPHRVEQEPFVARQQSQIGPLRKAALRYSIGSGTVDPRGRFSATVELVVQPGRETHCTVRMPTDVSLLQLVVGDQRVRQKTALDGSWTVPLGPPFMPRKIFVTYQTDTAWQETRLRPPLPDVLIGNQKLPLRNMLWRIRPVGGLRLGDIVVGSRMSREQFVQASDDFALQTVKDAHSLALELPASERQTWLRSWIKNLQRERSVHGRGEDRAAGASSQVSLTGDDQELSNPMLRDLMLVATEAPPPVDYPPQRLVRPSGAIDDGTRYYQSDSAGQLSVAAHRPGQNRLWRWLTAIMVVASGVLAVRRLRADPDWYDRLSHWPHAWAFALGAAWWGLFQPSAIGLLILTLATCSLLRQQWHRYRQRIEKTRGVWGGTPQ